MHQDENPAGENKNVQVRGFFHIQVELEGNLYEAASWGLPDHCTILNLETSPISDLQYWGGSKSKNMPIRG